jgi:hypothetical protein
MCCRELEQVWDCRLEVQNLVKYRTALQQLSFKYFATVVQLRYYCNSHSIRTTTIGMASQSSNPLEGCIELR